MSADIPFWQRKRLSEMTQEEWESLCDGCGLCCLAKLEDEDTGEIWYTDLACPYMDLKTGRCTTYDTRLEKVPECTLLTADTITQYEWLPHTCAYRTLSEGRPLADWHPLRSGDPASVEKAGISVKNRVIHIDTVPEEDWEEHIIHWVL